MATSAAPTKPTSLWEDFVDIFYAPAAVYARRREGKFGIALLVYVILATAITTAGRPLMQPIFDTMTAQGEARAREQNPQVTEAQLRAGRDIQERMTTGPVGIAFFAITNTVMVFLVGFMLFLSGKLFDSSASAGQATMVAAYAFFPRLLGTVVGVALLYFTPPEQLTSMTAMTISPARFVDPIASPVLAALLARFDVFVLWGTALLGIGISIVGKTSRGKGLAAAFVVWLVATLSAVGQAFAASS